MSFRTIAFFMINNNVSYILFEFSYLCLYFYNLKSCAASNLFMCFDRNGKFADSQKCSIVFVYSNSSINLYYRIFKNCGINKL